MISIRKDNRNFYLVASCFLISALLLIYYFFYTGGNFSDSIVPELFGFCLEGVFFVLLFSHLRRVEENKRKAELRSVMLSSVSNFLFVVKCACEYASNQKFVDEGRPFSMSTGVIHQIHDVLKSNEKEIESTLKDIAEEARRSHVGAKDMRAVAMLLEPWDISCWDMIVRNLKAVSESETNAGVIKRIYHFTDSLLWFGLPE